MQEQRDLTSNVVYIKALLTFYDQLVDSRELLVDMRAICLNTKTPPWTGTEREEQRQRVKDRGRGKEVKYKTSHIYSKLFYCTSGFKEP